MAKETIDYDIFQKNIFLNCPFDDEYMCLMRPLIFTIIHCGFNPRIALERLDSIEVRFEKIIELIDSSMYSIHDLSRIKSTKVNEYYRLNMPFEIGLDVGCKLYNKDEMYQNKKALILEGERFSCQKALSDLAHADVCCHDNEAENVVYEVRDWLKNTAKIDLAPSSYIWDNYNTFYSDLLSNLHHKGRKKKDI